MGHCCNLDLFSASHSIADILRTELSLWTYCFGWFWSGEHEEDVPSAPNVICRCDSFPLALRYLLLSSKLWHFAHGTPTTPTGSQQRDAVWVGLLPQERACRPELPFHLICLRATRSGQWRLCPVSGSIRPYIQPNTSKENALTGSRPLLLLKATFDVPKLCHKETIVPLHMRK